MKLTIPRHLYTDEPFLVQECQRNAASAQKAVYDRYADRLMLICLRYTGNGEDAKEILMDTFLNAFRGINSFTYTGAGSLWGWLKKIAVNQCLMRLRRQKQSMIALSDADEERFSGTGQEDILAALGSKELLLLIRQLPPGYKAVFNLYVFEEMSHKEIAALLEISEQTSKSQLHRARALLQQQILQQQNTGL